MASIVVAGDTSGTVTLTAPATAGTTTLTLPTTTGTVLASNSASTINSGTSSSMTLQTNGTTAMTIDTSQRVSIGGTTVTDAHLLNIQGPTTTNNVGVVLNDTTNSKIYAIDNGGSALKFYDYTANAERMRIDSSGNVMINTTTAAASTGGLNVNSTASGSEAVVLSLMNRGTANNTTATISWRGLTNAGAENDYGYIKMIEVDTTAKSSALSFWNQSSGTLGERMRINTDGAIRMNCANFSTGPSSSSSGVALESNGGQPFWNHAVTGTGLTTYYAFINSNGVVGTIRCTGSSTQYNTSSDYRLKEDVKPMVGALDKVALLKPVTYKWKVDGTDGQGFIAHELAEVVPECVSGEKDAVNEDGSINPQGIDTSHLVATLTAAIQEQQAIIETLKADIEDLKAKVK